MTKSPGLLRATVTRPTGPIKNGIRSDQASRLTTPSTNTLKRKAVGGVIYSCLPIAERTGLKVPLIMRFEDNYPEPPQEKVIADMKRWGFE